LVSNLAAQSASALAGIIRDTNSALTVGAQVEARHT
jgi:hypothetical protein